MDSELEILRLIHRKKVIEETVIASKSFYEQTADELAETIKLFEEHIELEGKLTESRNYISHKLNAKKCSES